MANVTRYGMLDDLLTDLTLLKKASAQSRRLAIQ